MKHDLDSFFKPKSIAVVGASKNPTKIGHATLKNILISDYQCKVYPINLKEKEILGQKCYKKLADVPGKIDLVLVSVPAPIVPQIIRECIEKKVQNVIIISSGFSEVGNDKLENEIKKIVDDTMSQLHEFKKKHRPVFDSTIDRCIALIKENLNPEQKQKMDRLYERLKQRRDSRIRRH